MGICSQKVLSSSASVRAVNTVIVLSAIVLARLGSDFCSPGYAAENRPEPLELSPAVQQQCLETLQSALDSDEFWPSIHAAEALTLAGYGDLVRQKLAPRLPLNQNDQQRCGLARELVRAGDRSQVAVMLAILSGADPFGHVHAAESLFKIRDVGDGVAVRNAFAQEEQQKLKHFAAAALARTGDREAAEYVRSQLTAKDPVIRQMSAWMLAELGTPEDIPQLIRTHKFATTDPERVQMELTLARLGDPLGIRMLPVNLGSKDPAIRVNAALIAGEAGAVQAQATLEALLADSSLDVRVRAAQSLLTLSRPRK